MQESGPILISYFEPVVNMLLFNTCHLTSNIMFHLKGAQRTNTYSIYNTCSAPFGYIYTCSQYWSDWHTDAILIVYHALFFHGACSCTISHSFYLLLYIAFILKHPLPKNPSPLSRLYSIYLCTYMCIFL